MPAFSARTRLRRLFDMRRDVSDLLAPTAVVHPEGFEPALARELVKTELDDAQRKLPVGMLCNVNSTSVGGSLE